MTQFVDWAIPLKSTPTSTRTHIINIVLASERRSYTPPTCLYPMKQTTLDMPTRQCQVIQFDTDKADITRPGTDEAKAAHIFIIGHRHGGGIWLSIAGAMGVSLSLSRRRHVITIYTNLIEKMRPEDDNHCSCLIGEIGRASCRERV